MAQAIANAVDSGSMVRTADGTLVVPGEVTSETWPARVWRWPTRWIPESWPAWAVTLAVVSFWAAVLWILTKTLKGFRHD